MRMPPLYSLGPRLPLAQTCCLLRRRAADCTGVLLFSPCAGVLLITPEFSLVIVEGCGKAHKRYAKLMLRRIDWSLPAPKQVRPVPYARRQCDARAAALQWCKARVGLGGASLVNR